MGLCSDSGKISGQGFVPLVLFSLLRSKAVDGVGGQHPGEDILPLLLSSLATCCGEVAFVAEDSFTLVCESFVEVDVNLFLLVLILCCLVFCGGKGKRPKVEPMGLPVFDVAVEEDVVVLHRGTPIKARPPQLGGVITP